QVAPPEKFSLAIPDFHREVSRMLGDVPVAQWQAYLRFRLADAAAPYLGDAFTTASFDFYGRTLQGQEEQRPRWKRVLSVLESAAGDTVARTYVQVAFPPGARARMVELVAGRSTALKAGTENLEGMSGATKQRALEKWGAF